MESSKEGVPFEASNFFDQRLRRIDRSQQLGWDLGKERAVDEVAGLHRGAGGHFTSATPHPNRVNYAHCVQIDLFCVSANDLLQPLSRLGPAPHQRHSTCDDSWICEQEKISVRFAPLKHGC